MNYKVKKVMLEFCRFVLALFLYSPIYKLNSKYVFVLFVTIVLLILAVILLLIHQYKII